MLDLKVHGTRLARDGAGSLELDDGVSPGRERVHGEKRSRHGDKEAGDQGASSDKVASWHREEPNPQTGALSRSAFGRFPKEPVR